MMVLLSLLFNIKYRSKPRRYYKILSLQKKIVISRYTFYATNNTIFLEIDLNPICDVSFSSELKHLEAFLKFQPCVQLVLSGAGA